MSSEIQVWVCLFRFIFKSFVLFFFCGFCLCDWHIWTMVSFNFQTFDLIFKSFWYFALSFFDYATWSHQIMKKSSKNVDKRPRHVMLLSGIEWSLLLHTVQQRPPMLFSGHRKNCPFLWGISGISTPSNPCFLGPPESKGNEKERKSI